MIKIVFCLRRLPSLSHQQFSDYWYDRHAPLVRELAPELRIQRYVQSHALVVPELSAALEARGGLPPFDGVAELWWASAADMAAAGSTKVGRAAGRRLLADEREFIDLSASVIGYAQERVIVGGT